MTTDLSILCACHRWSENCLQERPMTPNFLPDCACPFPNDIFSTFSFADIARNCSRLRGDTQIMRPPRIWCRKLICALSSMPKPGTSDNPRAYLYRITHNLSADFHRHGQVGSAMPARRRIRRVAIRGWARKGDAPSSLKVLMVDVAELRVGL